MIFAKNTVISDARLDMRTRARGRACAVVAVGHAMRGDAHATPRAPRARPGSLEARATGFVRLTRSPRPSYFASTLVATMAKLRGEMAGSNTGINSTDGTPCSVRYKALSSSSKLSTTGARTARSAQ